jgi:hypothetical protein
MKYKFKNVQEEGYKILEDGHTMFPEDVRKRLNRLEYVENEILKLKEENLKLRASLRKTLYEAIHVNQFYKNTPKKVIEDFFRDEIELLQKQEEKSE